MGSTIVDQLLSAGTAEVRVLDNFVRGTWHNLAVADSRQRPGLEVIEGDIRDAATVERATAGIDYVFHQAALRVTRCAEAPREAVDVLIGGTLNVLEAAVRHKVKKIVAASSASVYGNPSCLPIDEGHVFNNRTLYGAGKIANEQMLRAYYEMFKLPYVALRYFNVYGPRMDMEGVYTEVMIRWLDAIEAGRRPLIFGDGSQSMDFVFVDDVARANLLALESEIADYAFNVGTGISTTLSQLCAALVRLMGSALEPEYREARKLGDASVRRAAIEKAEKLLHISAKIGLEEGVRRLIAWRRAAKARNLDMTGCKV